MPFNTFEDSITAAFVGEENVQIVFTERTDRDYVRDAVEQVEGILESEGWDKKPAYCALASYEGGYTVQTIALPDFLYADMSSGLRPFLDIMNEGSVYSEMGKSRIGPQLPENFFGLVVFNEAYMIEMRDDLTLDKKAEYDRVANERRISEHPDRVEIRFGYCLTLDGRLCGITRRRGGEPEWQDFPAIDWSAPNLDGKLPSQLVRLLLLFKDWAPSYIQERLSK